MELGGFHVGDVVLNLTSQVCEVIALDPLRGLLVREIRYDKLGRRIGQKWHADPAKCRKIERPAAAPPLGMTKPQIAQWLADYDVYTR